MSFLKKFFADYNKVEKSFIISVISVVFFVSCEYAIVRPASTSIFLATFTSKSFPVCWILAVPLNLFFVYIYNKFLPKLGCLKTFFLFVLLIIFFNNLTALFVGKFPYIIFFQFIFKDVYIVFAFKQTWSMIHTTINTKKAKSLYGLMFGVGGFGSVIGGLVSGFFAVTLKSHNLLLLSAPIYVLVFAIYSYALKNSKINDEDFKNLLIEGNGSSKEGFALFKKSNVLVYILLVVVFMQVSSALLDYQYNAFLETNIPNIDLRTQFTGRITSLINSISTVFQLLGGFVLIHYLGLKRAHLIVPIMLGINSLLFLAFPIFSMAVYSFVSIKSIDYSFFGIIREMLYIPLSLDEKYRAKAIIDVFAYRAAKAVASLFLISLQNIKVVNILLLVSIFSLIIYFLWSRVVVSMFKKHKEEINVQD